MQILNLDHVALLVKNIAASCKFYEDVLTLKSIPRPAFDFPGAWFQIGATQQLHLIGRQEAQEFVPLRSNHFAMQVASIKEAEQHLLAKNATFTGPKTRPDGAWQIFIQDPDGHYVELTEIV
ncbi:VOC family protein [Adhaeribacter aquaticus]|uniref:VOC family protein n=1 Tax=Adhaeribacter aquaticus TaxID=299567 RepID=UPI00042A6755|nr:VOC family protein [Adhaeribacter aquaticus]